MIEYDWPVVCLRNHALLALQCQQDSTLFRIFVQIAGLSPATLGPAICSFAAMHVPSTLSKGRDFHVSIRRCAQTSLNLQKIPGAALSCRHPFFFISFSWSRAAKGLKRGFPGKRNLKWQDVHLIRWHSKSVLSLFHQFLIHHGNGQSNCFVLWVFGIRKSMLDVVPAPLWGRRSSKLTSMAVFFDNLVVKDLNV